MTNTNRKANLTPCGNTLIVKVYRDDHGKTIQEYYGETADFEKARTIAKKLTIACALSAFYVTCSDYYADGIVGYHYNYID